MANWLLAYVDARDGRGADAAGPTLIGASRTVTSSSRSTRDRLLAQVNTRLPCDDDEPAVEPPPISVQRDLLLMKLIEVHGEHGRSDIPAELRKRVVNDC